jgi:hypothetical protein
MKSFFVKNRSFLLCWGLLFLLFAGLFVASGNLSDNELDKLVVAKVWAEPGFIKGDWFFGKTNLIELPFYILFYPLNKIFSLLYVSIIGRLLGYLLLSFGLSRLARRFGFGAISMVFCIGVFLFLGQSLWVGEWLLGGVENKVFSYGLVLIALDLAASKKYKTSSFLLGLSATMHILVGLWATIFIWVGFLCAKIMPRKKVVFSSAFVWVMSGFYVFYLIFDFLREVSVKSIFNPDWIYVVFRNPHHLLAKSFMKPDLLMLLVPVLLLGFFRLADSLKNRDDILFIRKVVLVSLGVFILGLILSFFEFSYSFLKLFPMRVGSVFFILFGCMFLYRLVLDELQKVVEDKPCSRFFQKKLMVVSYFFVFILYFFVSINFIKGVLLIRGYPEGVGAVLPSVEKIEYFKACDWVGLNTGLDELIIAPPGMAETYLWAKRPLVANFKYVPKSKGRLVEWYQRLIDLNGGNQIEHIGWEASNEITINYLGLVSEKYSEIATKYNAKYMITLNRDDLPYNKIYKNSLWAVYLL